MTQRKLQQIVTGQATTDGAGVELVRVIGQPALMDLDPFLLLDTFRSDDPDDYIAGFPPHPHRDLAGRFIHNWNPSSIPFSCSGISECTIPLPAVIH